jgi:dienelactone hydrolase
MRRGWRLGAAVAVFFAFAGACATSTGTPGQGTGEGSGSNGQSSGATSSGSAGQGTDDGGAGATSTGGGSGNGSGASGSGSGTTSSSSGSGGSGSGGGTKSSSGGADGGNSGTSGGGEGTKGCGETLPATTDYLQNGPFGTTIASTTTGADGGYTVVQPMPLGQNGFKHPIATWGNGITTTPTTYTTGNPALLQLIASHGFVVIASNNSTVSADDMTGGLDWMIAQNTTSGPYQGMLDTSCLVSIGYSLGGGMAITAGSHPNVVTTVAFHPIPGNAAALKTPLLLFTSTTDNINVPAMFVTPSFESSAVQTFYATLTDAGDPKDEGHLIVASALNLIDPVDPEYAPAIAWLRLWAYGDQGAKKYFWGSSALLCQGPDWECQSKIPPAAAQMSGF